MRQALKTLALPGLATRPEIKNERAPHSVAAPVQLRAGVPAGETMQGDAAAPSMPEATAASQRGLAE
eukprot:8409362-Prorocentrum_lima.AAC.1